MKKLLILFIPIFLLFSCKAKNENRYYNKEHKFSIEVPKEWTKKDGQIGEIVSFIFEDSKSFTKPNINILKDKTNETDLEKYIEGMINTIKTDKDIIDKLKNIKLIEKIPISIDKNKAIKITYTCLSELHKDNVQISPVVLLKNKEVYIITMVTSMDESKQYNDLFNKIIKSFRFE